MLDLQDKMFVEASDLQGVFSYASIHCPQSLEWIGPAHKYLIEYHPYDFSN